MPQFDTIAPGREPIASYQHIMELGRGGMGTVNLARAVGAGGFERIVVVKRLNREFLGQADAVGRFMDEARYAALIHHANVVGIHQIGRDGDGYFLVLDYVEGSSLDGLVDRAALRGQRMPPPIVLRIGLDALAGLHAAHSVEDGRGKRLGLLHRDVSLQNVLVGRDGVTRIADFGIAKSTVTSVVTDQGFMVGKLLYSPPEYLWRRPVGPTLDVYALGITLWIAFAGIDPWPDSDDAQLMARILHDRVPRLSDVGIQIAPTVDALIAKACDPDPARRFQTAREMADAIESIGRDTGWLAGHAEVAEYVEKLLGVELRQRRERIAHLVDEIRSTAPLHKSVAPPRDPPAAPTLPYSRLADLETAPFAVPLDRSRTRMITIALGAVAIAGAGLWAWTRSRTTPHPYEPLLVVSSAPSGHASLLPALPSAEPSPPTEPVSPEPTRSERTHSTFRAIDPSTLPRVAEHPLRPVAPQPAPAAAPAKPPLPSEPAPVAKPPDGISKTNPYR